MGWSEYILAFAVFFLSHSLPLRPSVKTALVARLGRRGFGVAYSALSLGVLYWLIVAAGRAPYVPLWERVGWQGHVTLAVMLGVCLLVALAVGRPNPFSFGGREGAGYDPERPGLIRYTRHPLLLALALWALAHLPPNGDLAHVVLFGLFAGFALLGHRIVDRRRKRLMGADWARLEALRRAAPLWPPHPAAWPATAARLALGLAGFALLIALHPLVIGVAPLP
ncbi:NnrU family protein [Roseovarius autotrophicus]|uniref:NnrU family protein n=1 Tax=Roseovarius autotrophicus TaxID=2824121 RepID=UPI0019E84731|nr:NnrU family protein [Roseovarius sp.]